MLKAHLLALRAPTACRYDSWQNGKAGESRAADYSPSADFSQVALPVLTKQQRQAANLASDPVAYEAIPRNPYAPGDRLQHGAGSRFSRLCPTRQDPGGEDASLWRCLRSASRRWRRSGRTAGRNACACAASHGYRVSAAWGSAGCSSAVSVARPHAGRSGAASAGAGPPNGRAGSYGVTVCPRGHAMATLR
jgi:hypothetical protein